MDISSAITWLESHVNFEGERPGKRSTNGESAITDSARSTLPDAGVVDGLSLAPMVELLAVLGDPHLTFRSIHITGTNGKGSTARVAAGLVAATDLSVGLYTSPDLYRLNERIAWDGKPIPDEDLARVLSLLASVEPLLEHKPTRFEFLTAAAYVWFAEMAVDVAVVEVGMLGTHDATNVVDADVAVITNIGKDHTSGADGWRDAIAKEKAGIIKPKSHVVLGSDLGSQFRHVNEREFVDLWQLGKEFEVSNSQLALGGHMADIRTPYGQYEQLYVPFHGAHQLDNIATALASVEALFGRGIDGALVDTAMATVELPGRFETVSAEPKIILDGAHNPDGAAAAITTLNNEFARLGSRILVVGLLRGKDPTEMLEALEAEDFDGLICTQPTWSRALPADELGAIAKGLGLAPEVVSDPVEALERAVAVAASEDLIFVSGSLYLVGDVRAAVVSTIEQNSQ